MFIGMPSNDQRQTTYCRVGGQLCRLVRVDETGGARVEWLADQPDADRQVADSLGLVRENEAAEVDVAVNRIERAFVHHEDAPRPVRPGFPPPAAFGESVRSSVSSDPTVGLTEAVRESAPPGWQEIRLDCTALGTRLEVVATVTTESGDQFWAPSTRIVRWLRRIRDISYTPELGTWTTARIRLTGDGIAQLETAYDQPVWEYARPESQERFREFYDELCLLPRGRDAAAWLLERAWEYHAVVLKSSEAAAGKSNELNEAAEPPNSEAGRVSPSLRMAEVFDGIDEEGTPLVFRPALPWSEKLPVFEYLRDGHFVLGAYSTSQDVVDPDRPPQVPNRFVTDGTWVWPSALAYYLDVHNVTPPVEFLDHIRRRGYQAPEIVAEHTIRQAETLVLGTELSGANDEKTAEAFELVLHRIGGLRVSKRFYSFEGPVEGGWTMLREADGWWSVFCTEDGARKNEERFHDVYDAGAHLVGCLTLTQDRLRREPDEVLEDYECPLRPLEADPPLSAYGGKLLTDLVPGDEVDRFGGTEGNTVFVAGTTIPQRALPSGSSPGEYRRYRVVAGFQVVSGTAHPEHGQVGGGVAYVLPRSVGDLVSGGWFVEA